MEFKKQNKGAEEIKDNDRSRNKFFFFKDFIYLFIETPGGGWWQRHRQREKQAPSRDSIQGP